MTAAGSTTVVTTTTTSDEGHSNSLDQFASEQLFEGYDRNPSCVNMVKLSMTSAGGDALNAEGFTGALDFGSDLMLWRCRGGTLGGYLLWRIGLTAVVASAFYVFVTPVLRKHADAHNAKMRAEVRASYDRPCNGSMEACRVPSGFVCFRETPTSVIRCSYPFKTAPRRGTREHYAVEVPTAEDLDAFLDAHLPPMPGMFVGLVAVLIGVVVSSLANLVWRWYAKSQVMRPEALFTEAFARTVF